MIWIEWKKYDVKTKSHYSKHLHGYKSLFSIHLNIQNKSIYRFASIYEIQSVDSKYPISIKNNKKCRRNL